MNRRQFIEQKCHFRAFCSQDYASIIAEKNSTSRTLKPIKVSLKDLAKNSKRVTSPSPTYHQRYTPSRYCPTVAQSSKIAKPIVKFSWKNQMVQTAKKVFQNTGKLEPSQIQLRETKAVKLNERLMIESNCSGQQFRTISGLNQHITQAKFQESLILIDYFNPSSQQMSKIASYLETQNE